MKSLLICESSRPAIIASSSNGSSRSGAGLGGRCIRGVQDSASIIGVSEVECCSTCGLSCRAAAVANDVSNGLRAGNDDATGVGNLSLAKLPVIGLPNCVLVTGDRNGERRSLDLALPTRIGVGGGRIDSSGEPTSISVSPKGEGSGVVINRNELPSKPG